MLENVILENLLHNEEYVKKVLPFLKEEYFSENNHLTVFSKIKDFVVKFNKAPTQDELLVELTSTKGLNQTDYESSVDTVKELTKRNKAPSYDWLLEQTEQFYKDRTLYNAIVSAASMIEDNKAEVGQIPDLLKDALSVSFENSIGHDFRGMVEERYNMLHKTNEYKIPFDLDDFNEIFSGGLSKKTLSVIAASTGAGKSLSLCHFAARNMLDGKNVLYITLEMAEERISERIDANILNTKLHDLSSISFENYKAKLDRALANCKGRLIVKEYPTAGAGVTHFRSLINELKLKKDFNPDIVYIDYVNICSSSRYKAGGVNSYQMIKAICEEIRGLAIECNLPIVSATQLNREGTDNSDAGLKEISESAGLAMTVDVLLAMIRSEELDAQNLVMFKQLKNRFSDMASKLRFVVGIDRSKMKLFNAETSVKMTQTKIVVDGSPRNNSGAEKPQFGNKKPETNRARFNGIKV
jgi:replicative DNA helicase